jgi:hypothetical protein
LNKHAIGAIESGLNAILYNRTGADIRDGITAVNDLSGLVRLPDKSLHWIADGSPHPVQTWLYRTLFPD